MRYLHTNNDDVAQALAAGDFSAMSTPPADWRPSAEVAAVPTMQDPDAPKTSTPAEKDAAEGETESKISEEPK